MKCKQFEITKKNCRDMFYELLTTFIACHFCSCHLSMPPVQSTVLFYVVTSFFSEVYAFFFKHLWVFAWTKGNPNSLEIHIYCKRDLNKKFLLNIYEITVMFFHGCLFYYNISQRVLNELIIFKHTPEFYSRIPLANCIRHT